VTYSLRRERLAARLGSAGVDALLVSDLINVRYLTGFTGSNAALLVFGDDRTPVLATDSRYRTQAARQSPDLDVAIERACGRHLAERAVEAGARRVGFESHVVTVDGFEVLRRAVAGEGGAGASSRAVPPPALGGSGMSASEMPISAIMAACSAQ